MKRAWIRNGYRLVYSMREIRRGQNKGKLEVTYRKGSRFRKMVISQSSLLKERAAG
jgi:hypothetical protein